MRKIACCMIALALALIAVAVGEPAADNRTVLWDMLAAAADYASIAQFDYGDYDGDGSCEAFAILSDYGWGEDGISGEIWFAGLAGCVKLHDWDSYSTAGMIGVGPSLYAAEVWYGGSGSSSIVWGVRNSVEAVAMGNGFEGISGGEAPNEFYMYPGAFDLNTDATGHTWKRYYFFLDGLALKEYGGLWISRDELEEVEGAEAILSAAEAQGWRIGEIYYRANGVINVNLFNDSTNDNLTLRFDGSRVIDTGERFGGRYEAASGLAEAVYPAQMAHEVSPGSSMGRALANAGEDRQTLSGGAREEILRARGVFDTDALINVTGARFREEAGNQLMRVYFEDEVFYGGSDGYLQEWLTANGALSEAMADLDGDGTDEYVLVYLVSQPDTADYGYTHWENQWNVAIYEPQGDGYALASEFPVYFPWWERRSVGLINTVEGVKILTTFSGGWDGGGGAVAAAVYGYDGQSASAEAVMYASVGEDSCLAVGPLAPDDAIAIFNGLYDDGPAVMDRLGLVKDVNYWFHASLGWDYDGRVFERDDSEGFILNRKAFLGFEEITGRAGAYGIHAFCTIRTENDDGRAYEYYETHVERGDVILLYATEGFDDESAYIDIVTHYEASPIIDAAGREGDLPAPLSVIPPVPTDAGAALEDLNAVADDARETQTQAQPRSVRVTGDVNMRDMPGLEGSVIASVGKGTMLEYLGDVSTDWRGVDWYRVRYDGREGWVSSKYAVIGEGSTPSSSAPSAQPAQPVEPAQSVGSAHTTGDVNMRDKPSLNSGVVTSVPKGTTVEFLGDVSTDERGVDWYRIRHKGIEGWSSSKYTRLD